MINSEFFNNNLAINVTGNDIIIKGKKVSGSNYAIISSGNNVFIISNYSRIYNKGKSKTKTV